MLRCLLFGSHFLWPCAGEFPQGNFDFGVFRSFWFEYVLRLRCWFFFRLPFLPFFSPVTLYHFGLSCVFSCYILWVRRKKPNKYTHTHKLKPSKEQNEVEKKNENILCMHCERKGRRVWMWNGKMPNGELTQNAFQLVLFNLRWFGLTFEQK